MKQKKGDWRAQITAYVPIVVLEACDRYGINRADVIRAALARAVEEHDQKAKVGAE